MHDLAVLVIDDDKAMRRTIRAALETLDCRVVDAPSAPAARAALEQQRFDVALLDARLGVDDGIELLPLFACDRAIDVVVMSATASIESAVEAMRRGASDYLAKPFSSEQLRALVGRIAERRSVERRVDGERKRRNGATLDIHLQTQAPLMLQALDLTARAAASDRPVLLVGEHGTGKGLLARRLHALSPRGGEPFVTADAGEARDVELLAVRAGAATGGTLFVDAVERLPPARQEALVELSAAPVRVVAATTRELALDRFLMLHVPALRERREDILPLARRALAFYAQGTPVPKAELTPEAEQALVAYPWPGNVRELCQAMERAAVLRAGVRVGVEALPETVVSSRAVGPYLGGAFTIDAIEREHIFRVLASASSIDEAARVLGIDASTLWRKRKRYEE